MLENLEQLIKTIRKRKNSSPEESYTNKLLNDKGLSVAKVKEENQNEHIDENIVDGKSSNQKIKNVLDEFCINLNMKAKKGKIDKLIGRKNEIDRTIQILCRRQKNNPLFVGDAGVGKTAIAEGLAKRIIEKDVPEIILDAVIYSLDMGSLLAGTRYRGDFEERLKEVLKELQKENNEILEVRGAGFLIGIKTKSNNLEINNILTKNGLLCVPAADNIIRLAPPLIISKNEINEGLQIIKKTLRSNP